MILRSARGPIVGSGARILYIRLPLSRSLVESLFGESPKVARLATSSTLAHIGWYVGLALPARKRPNQTATHQAIGAHGSGCKLFLERLPADVRTADGGAA